MNKIKTPSNAAMVWREFRKSWLNRLGIVAILAMMLVAILAPFLANSKPLYLKHEGKHSFPVLKTLWPLTHWNLYPELQEADYAQLKREGATVLFPLTPYSPNDYDLDAFLTPPTAKHWLGTDEQGRDILSRLIFGARISLSVGFVAVSIYTLLGVIIGAIAGYFGGWVDLAISRLMEVMICFPTFFLILTLLAVVGPSIYYIMIVIGLTGWPGIARLVRGEFLRLRGQDFVSACRNQGMSNRRIIARHILPNALAPVWVSTSFGIAAAILTESALSFLGFGVQPPTPSWGDLLSQSRDFIDIAWWLTLFPGLMIFVTITAFNLVGEGLRDALDPKLRGSA